MHLRDEDGVGSQSRKYGFVTAQFNRLIDLRDITYILLVNYLLPGRYSSCLDLVILPETRVKSVILRVVMVLWSFGTCIQSALLPRKNWLRPAVSVFGVKGWGEDCWPKFRCCLLMGLCVLTRT